ncbi:MAG: hypothetical protein ACP5G1_01615 [Nanopusillaceae archaeon]
MRVWKISLLILIFWIIFINVFSNYEIKIEENKTKNFGNSSNVNIGTMASLTVEVKRAKYFFIFPTYIYFYKPIISNFNIYLVPGEIRVFEITIALIIITLILFIFDILKRKDYELI